MKSNIIPFGVIAIIGIFAVVIFSSLGVSQRADFENEGENGGNGEETEEVAEVGEAEQGVQNAGSSCHGDDLSGGAARGLTSVGSDHSEEDILPVIQDGPGSAPPGLIEGEDADKGAAWFAE